MITKINIEISPSINYTKITLGLVDEPIDYDGTDEDFKIKVRAKFELLKELVMEQFNKKKE